MPVKQVKFCSMFPLAVPYPGRFFIGFISILIIYVCGLNKKNEYNCGGYNGI